MPDQNATPTNVPPAAAKPTIKSVLADDVAQAEAGIKAKISGFFAAHPVASLLGAVGLGVVIVELVRRFL